MLLIKDGFLIFLMLVFTSKYMLYSVTDSSALVNILSVAIGLVLLIRKKFVIKKFGVYEQLGLCFFIAAFIIFNVSKFFGELTTINAIVPTGIVLLFMMLIPFCHHKSTLKYALLLYSKFNFFLLLIGLPIFFLSIGGIIQSSILVHASDHANPAGYVSLYGLAYYPSWFKINLLSMSYYRFSGIFWEPGTLGLYMVFLVTIELAIFNKIDKYSKYRISIFVVAGLASLSLLFFVAMVMLLFLTALTHITHKKYLFSIIFIIIICLAIFYIYYDYLYALILYRFDIDAQRGFTGNTRSGVFQEFLQQFSSGNMYQQLFGFGPYAEFEGDSTSFVIKIFQRGIVGFTLILMSFLSFCHGKGVNYLIPIWLISLAILCQFEGAIFLLTLSCLFIKSKNDKYTHQLDVR